MGQLALERDVQGAVRILLRVAGPPESEVDLLDARLVDGVLLPVHDRRFDRIEHTADLGALELRLPRPLTGAFVRPRMLDFSRLISLPTLFRGEPLLDEGGICEAEAGEGDLGGGVDEFGRGEAGEAAVGLGFREGGGDG